MGIVYTYRYVKTISERAWPRNTSLLNYGSGRGFSGQCRNVIAGHYVRPSGLLLGIDEKKIFGREDVR
jgi:hypothetical protein